MVKTRYIKETKHVISDIEGVVLEEGDLLVTADVTSFYTNSSHKDGMEAVSHFLTKAVYILPPERLYSSTS